MTLSSSGRTVLVIGATGNQGGGVVEHLLASDHWQVRGMTRDPESSKTRELAGRGVEMVRGDMDDESSVRAAMDGVYGVFSVQGQAPAGDPMYEARQGMAMVDLAVAEGVEHLVYSSSCGAKEPDRGVSYWDAKRAVAKHLMGIDGMDWTITRPVSFMENYVGDAGALERGVITGMLTPDKTLQVISGHDIGRWAVAAFERRGEFAGRAIDIAAETITMDGIAAILGGVVGHEIVYRQLSPAGTAGAEESAIAMTRWYQEHGYDEDIEALDARWGVPMLGFEEWLRTVWQRRSVDRPV